MSPLQNSPAERNALQAISALKRGSYLLKYGRQGKPKFCPFHLSSDETTLIWYAGKEEKQLRLSQVSRIMPGQRTANFQRYPQPEKEYQSFSLVYGKKSLDLICKDKYEAEIWFVALQALISRGDCKKRTEIKTEGTLSEYCSTDPKERNSQSILSKGSGYTVHEERQHHQVIDVSFPSEKKRGRVLADFLSDDAGSQCSPKRKSVLCSSQPHSNFDDVSSRNSVDTARASFSSVLSTASSLESSLGDISLSNIFIWGEGIRDGTLSGVRESNDSKDAFLPKVLESASALEAQHIACGRRHAVLTTRQGQLYSWGDGSGGKLGHGTETDIFTPKLIDTLDSSRIVSTDCGEYHTCAVTLTGDLYTWGDGIHNFGLLGHGNKFSYWTPRKVGGPMDGNHITNISCGPWHSAAITSTGQLFTFGDGTFGALGHGDRNYSSVPKAVETLKGLKAVGVSCGFWHSAAIVEIPSETPVARKLFTWGNGDGGQLGHGDKLSRLVPSCVCTPNDENFCQVACGHSITVALTVCGKVYSTGHANYGGKAHALPVRIEGKLKNLFVEEISCGSHHVVAVTSTSEVFTWGKGRNGQLGHGDNSDQNSPTLVEALKGKQVKRVFCGNNFTAAICLHQRVCAADYSICASCRVTFSFRHKRHNCYNCGLVFCKACTNKKSLNASLAPSTNKPYRVCEDCFGKLNKGIVTKTSSRPPKSKQHGVLSRLPSFVSLKRSSTHLPPKNHKLYPRDSPDLSTFDCSEKINSLLPGSRTHSLASSPVSIESSPAHSVELAQLSFDGVTYHDEVIDDSKRTNDILTEEISVLREQVEVLKRKSQFLASELERTSSELKEATAWFQDEYEKNNAAKVAIKCLMMQLKEMAVRVQPGLSCRASGPFADSISRLSTAST